MKKSIDIRLLKNDNGEYCFKYRGSDVERTPNGLSSIIKEGIHKGNIAKGIKVVDKDYVRYIFDYYDSDDLKALQKPVKMVIRIRKEYVKDAYNILKDLDALCLETKYIKTKNMVKILAAGLTGVILLSIAGAKIVDRIRDPEHYDFGRNGEYSNSADNEVGKSSQDNLMSVYEEVYNDIHKK